MPILTTHPLSITRLAARAAALLPALLVLSGCGAVLEGTLKNVAAGEPAEVVPASNMPPPPPGEWMCFQFRHGNKTHSQCGRGLDGCAKNADMKRENRFISDVGSCVPVDHASCTYVSSEGHGGSHICYLSSKECKSSVGTVHLGAGSGKAKQTECKDVDFPRQ